MTNDALLDHVASTIRESLVKRPEKFDRKIFLGGAAPGTSGAIRDRLARALKETEGDAWFDSIDIYYPETLFEGLMTGPNRYDLLTLENMLAQAVDAVVLIVESAGALAELGAFANHSQLRKKLVVVQRETYRNAKSFVAHGPVRSLLDDSDGVVVYLNFDNVENEADKVRTAISRIAKKYYASFDFSNILHAHHFVIPCLFVMERLARAEITRLVGSVSDISQAKAEIVASSAISILLRDRTIYLDQDRFGLTEAGLRDFFRHFSRRKAQYNRKAIDRLRVEVLTQQRRGNRAWV